MSDMKTTETMSLFGGHPVLDFVNTMDSRIGRLGPDYLQTYRDLLVFAERTALIDPVDRKALERRSSEDPDGAEGSLRRAKALREALYRICRRESAGGPTDAADLALIEQAALQALSRRRLSAGSSGIAWTFPQAADLDTVADRIAIAAMDLLLNAGSARRPIRECPGRHCGWLFLDTSRGGRRLWCSDKTCGTGARVRRFRAG